MLGRDLRANFTWAAPFLQLDCEPFALILLFSFSKFWILEREKWNKKLVPISKATKIRNSYKRLMVSAKRGSLFNSLCIPSMILNIQIKITAWKNGNGKPTYCHKSLTNRGALVCSCSWKIKSYSCKNVTKLNKISYLR